MILKDKKGYSLSGWTEGILFCVLIVLILGIVIGGMNVKYGKDYQIGLGGNTTESAFEDYQGTLEAEIKGGEAEFDSASGITLKSSWGIIKSVGTIIWDFLTGGWIETVATNYMRLPPQVAVTFRVLYFLSVGFTILYLLFKVKS